MGIGARYAEVMSNRGTLAPLFSDIRLSADEAAVMAGGLRDVAEVDGTHPEEAELIESLVGEMAADLGDVPSVPRVTPADIAARLVDPTLRTVFLQSALLLAMADGVISEPERARIRQYASALGVSDVAYAELEHVIESWVRSGDAEALFA